MLYCQKCGNQLPDGSRFCNVCGNAIDTSTNTQRKIVFEGAVHKCPNCGEVLDTLDAKCPSCGYELRGKSSSNSVKEFASKLSEIETTEGKIALIKNFPIPNTKEDIFEFMVLASSNFHEYYLGSQKEIAMAWLSKMEQGYSKAKILFGDDKDLLKIVKLYNRANSKINASSRKVRIKWVLGIIFRTAIVWAGLLLFVLAFYIDVNSNFKYNSAGYQLGAMIVMVVGAFTIGKKEKELGDGIFAILCGAIAMILGTIEYKNHANGSAMELTGLLTIIISTVKSIFILRKK